MPDAPPSRGVDSRKPTAPEVLERGAATYRERNKVYGDNYKQFGHAMAAIFPDGLTVKTPEQWNRLGVFVQVMSKASRYAINMPQGTGHEDSALDLSVYAAMLHELTGL